MPGWTLVDIVIVRLERPEEPGARTRKAGVMVGTGVEEGGAMNRARVPPPRLPKDPRIAGCRVTVRLTFPEKPLRLDSVMVVVVLLPIGDMIVFVIARLKSTTWNVMLAS